jgi:hypothetical protein
MRLATTSMMVSFFLTAMHLKGLLQCGASEMMRVPSLVGFFEFSTSTGMFLRTAGRMVAGCSTLAPK